MRFLLQGFLAALLLSAAPFTSAVDFTRVQSARISHMVAKVLENVHYRHAALDDTISEKFLRNYLDALDYNHLVFTKADIDEFEAKYGKRLDDLLDPKDPKGVADARPAYEIFDRYLLRLGERDAFTAKILKEKFDFSTDETILSNRHKAEWPKDQAEAEALWRGRIKYELLAARLGKETEEEAAKRIAKRYDRLEKTMKEFDNEEILQTYLDALAHVYDPHSDYMGPTEAQEFDIKHISLTLSGIGATLQWDDGYTKIVSMVPGGPAAKSKLLHPNDRIVSVAQGKGEPVDVVEMRLNKVVQLIRGTRGTPVTLTVIPADSTDGTARKTFTIIRDEIKLKDQMAKARVYEHKTEDGKIQRLGFIDLPQFYDNCAEHVDTLIGRLKKEKVEGIVLDLRHNGGGILEESVNLVGLFINKGPVVQVRNSEKKTTVYNDTNPSVSWDGPLIVLVGRLSASASEITAAALQDYGRALIVGDQSTHGKGTVQQVINLARVMGTDPMPNPGEIKVTVSKFYRVAGTTTQKQGVTPDLILPSIYDYLDIGETSLDNALEADSIAPAKYEPLGEVKQYVSELEKASKARVSKSKDFAYVLEDIAEVKKRKDEKTISLNEKIRIKERDEQKARTEARKKERASRTVAADKAWVVDLETAEKNKPLAIYTTKKTEEEKALIAPKSNPDAADEDDLGEDDTEVVYDAQLTESIDILSDYSRLMAGKTLKASDSVALKKDEPKTATP
jgi:carboxyl-terminal processing protease